MDHPASADNQNESTEKPKIAKLEFQQSFAVAQLAVKLCTLKKAESKAPLERESLTPGNFLAAAWELIQSARKHVSRPQTDAEYLAAHGGSDEATENVLVRSQSKSHIPFQKLCDPKYRNKGVSVTIHGVTWKVFRSERAFDNLFWSYWDATSIIKDEGERKDYGQKVLDSWKRDGVPPNTFLALASGYFDFERAVKFITGEGRLDCALPWFRRFLKSRFADEDMAERAMAEYREKRFAPLEPYSLKDEFVKWKRLEKSRLAQGSRKARGKRGRVRSKRENRLGAR